MLDWVALTLVLVVMIFVGYSLTDLRHDASEVRGRLIALEEEVEHADKVGSTALHAHIDTPVGRAHPITQTMVCPYCPPCK